MKINGVSGKKLPKSVMERFAYALSINDVDKLVKIAGTEHDARRVLSDEDVAEIRELHSDGISVYRISKDFNVAWGTIKRIVDDEYRKQANKYRQQFAPTCGTYATGLRRVSKKRALIANRGISVIGEVM